MDIYNKVPWLGKFDYSPIYLLVKKEAGKIVEILTLPTPSSEKEPNLGKFGKIIMKRFNV
jgi:hypothetical protein